MAIQLGDTVCITEDHKLSTDSGIITVKSFVDLGYVADHFMDGGEMKYHVVFEDVEFESHGSIQSASGIFTAKQLHP